MLRTDRTPFGFIVGDANSSYYEKPFSSPKKVNVTQVTQASGSKICSGCVTTLAGSAVKSSPVVALNCQAEERLYLAFSRKDFRGKTLSNKSKQSPNSFY